MRVRACIIRDFDSASYQASLEIEGYCGSLVRHVPVATHVPVEQLVDGTRGVVLFLDDLSPLAGMLIGLYPQE